LHCPGKVVKYQIAVEKTELCWRATRELAVDESKVLSKIE